MSRFAPLVSAGVLLLGGFSFAAPPVLAERNQQRPGREMPVMRATEVEPDSSVYSTVKIDDNYLLRPGDRVSFSVQEDRRPSIELVVQASGEIDVPAVGRFRAANMTCRDVAVKLKAELERNYYKKATVNLALNQSGSTTLQSTSNIRIYFLGAVRSQGAREFAPDGTITVSKAILIAGGFGDFADQKKVQLIRRLPDGKSQITVVNVANLLKGKPGIDPVIKAEDMIRVPERLLNF